jgi:hypothetical protein
MSSNKKSSVSQIQNGDQDGSGENKQPSSQSKRSVRNFRNTSNSNSRNNSRNNSPVKAPKSKQHSDEIWDCNICKKRFVDVNDMLLECQRCKDHFCIKCLNKTVDEYKIMENSDIMWFCASCREKVERNIVVDREIEERCKEYFSKFEKRLS